MCPMQKLPDKIGVCVLLENSCCLLQFSLLSLGTWRWPLDIWKICGSLYKMKIISHITKDCLLRVVSCGWS
jgi:hypothetical protein